MAHIEDVLLWAIAQDGERYVFGAEASPLDPDPERWDCSEIVEWACARAGVQPKVPDGAYYQWRHVANYGTGLDVASALRTRGALLFAGDGTGVGRQAIVHVAWSLGDGTTFEARGSRWGVGTWAAAARFDFAGLIPGVSYAPIDAAPEDAMADPQVLDRLARMEAMLNRVHYETATGDGNLAKVVGYARTAATRQATNSVDVKALADALRSDLGPAVAKDLAHELAQRLTS